MIDNDTSRLSRLTAILTLLLSKRVLTANDISKKFDISTRTVYRDIRALEEAGVPIVSEVGVGYSLADDYKLPPIMFTKDEAASFLTAEKFIQKLSDKQTSAAYSTAINKIRSVLRNSDKDYLENLDENIEVIKNRYLPIKEEDHQYIPNILKSISEKTVIHIDYEAVTTYEKSSRDIEPVGIYFTASRWYMIAYCLEKNDYRNFRIDRITRLTNTSIKNKKEHPTLKTYLEKLTREEKEVQQVVISIEKQYAHYLGEQKYYMGFVEEKIKGDTIEITFLSACLQNFARGFIMYGDHAKIISPPELKEVVKTFASEVIKNL